MASQNPFDQQKPIPGIQKVIAIASGKGGVGKSSLAFNLSVALAQKARVGLLDADIYGPSVPRLLGLKNESPDVKAGKIIPHHKFNLKAMSIGFFNPEETSLIWRGPMLFKAMDQLLFQVEWGALDFLIVDLPPGTGDVPLSLAQKTPVSGVIMISTPQNLSLVDVKKSITMWEELHIPILGLVENMSYFLHPESGEKIPLYPQGELNEYLDLKAIPKWAQIPFIPELAEMSDRGEAYALSKSSSFFQDLSEKLLK